MWHGPLSEPRQPKPGEKGAASSLRAPGTAQATAVHKASGAARAWAGARPFKTQNATWGEIKKNSKGKKKGKCLDGGKRN